MENVKAAGIKVAGVTFNNPDGTSRQKILSSFVGWRTAKLHETVFTPENGEPERAVEVCINGNLIGYIPRAQLDNPMSYQSELTVLVSMYKDKYYAVLYPRIVPSSKEYATMKRICTQLHRPMPAYDRRAYMSYWAVLNH